MGGSRSLWKGELEYIIMDGGLSQMGRWKEEGQCGSLEEKKAPKVSGTVMRCGIVGGSVLLWG